MTSSVAQSYFDEKLALVASPQEVNLTDLKLPEPTITTSDRKLRLEIDGLGHTVLNESRYNMISIKETSQKSLIPPSKDLANAIVSILTPSMQTRTSCRKAAHIAAKIILSGMCYVAHGAALEPAKRNFSNETLQNVVAYSDVFAWGTLSAYCISTLYDRMLEKPHLSSQIQKGTCRTIAYWTAVFTLGLLTELPTVYTSWYYNRNSPFLYLFAPLVGSLFSALSVEEFFRELSKPTSRIRNSKCRLPPTDLQIAREHKRFCELMSCCKEAVSQSFEPKLHGEIQKILTSADQELIVKSIVLEAITVGLQHARSDLATRTVTIKNVGKGVKTISSLLAIGSPILDGILIYKGYHLVLNSDIPIPFIIILAVSPGIYLQVKLSKDFYYSIFSKTMQIVKTKRCPSIAPLFSTILKCIFVAALTVFGLAGDVTVVRDNVGFDNVYGSLIGISVISTMAILLITSMNSIFNDIGGFFQKKRRTVRQIEHDTLLEHVGNLEEYFSTISRGEFQQLVEEMDLNQITFTTVNEKEMSELSPSTPDEQKDITRV